MDPLVNILPDLHEMVFLQFNFADFQEITQVTPLWNEKLGESWKMMEKVKINIYKPLSDVCRFLEIVENKGTKRRYQNMYIGPCISNCPLSQKILKYFLNTRQTLLDLGIRYLPQLNTENAKFFDELDLSKLKILKLYSNTEEFTNKLLDRCSSLDNLSLRGNSSEIIRITSLRSSLERNQKLQSLELDHQYHNVLFSEDISDIARLELKIYKLKDGGHSERVTEIADRNFVKFLANQSQSLNRLHISFCRPNVIEHIFNNLPALKYLKIFHKFRTEELRLNLIENIVELSIPNLGKSADIERIIPFVPNVTKLHIKVLSRRNIEVIARHLAALQKLLFVRRHESANTTGPTWATLWPNAIPVCRYASVSFE